MGDWSSAFVRGMQAFHPLSGEERELLSPLEQSTLEIPAKSKVVAEGKRHDRAFIVKAGWMIEYKQFRDGRRQILNFRLPGEMAGIDALGFCVAPHSVQAVTNCVLAPVELDSFQDLQRRAPKLATLLFLMTLREEAVLHQWEASLGRRRASERVAHLLLELHHRLRLRGVIEGTSFEFPPTQQDLADSLGFTVPYINQILQDLRRKGLIRTSDRKLEIADYAGLAAVARFDPHYLRGDSGALVSCPSTAEPAGG